MDPPVSEPNESGVRRAATATAEPPLDPPGTRSVAQGFLAGPNAEFSFEDPIANSSQFVLPITMAPALSMRSITVALYGGTNVSRIREDAVVFSPRVQMLSLTAMGTPASGADANCDRCASMCAARARARSASTVLKAFSVGFAAWMRSSAARHASTADTTFIDLSSDNPGHFEEAAVPDSFPLPRVGEDLVDRQRRPQLVRTFDALLRNAATVRRRCGRDAARVDLIQFFDVSEHVTELAREQLDLVRLELEVGERGHRFDLRFGQLRHVQQMLACGPDDSASRGRGRMVSGHGQSARVGCRSLPCGRDARRERRACRAHRAACGADVLRAGRRARVSSAPRPGL